MSAVNVVTIIEKGKKYQFGNSILSLEELNALREIRKDDSWLFLKSAKPDIKK